MIYPIGIILESFRRPVDESLAIAKKLGVQGLQIYATHGPLNHNNLTEKDIKEFYKMVLDHGLSISAVCGDLGHGFGNPEDNPKLIAESKVIMEKTLLLGTNIVTTHIGVVPKDPAHPRYKIMQDACGELAEYADSLKAKFAVETGPEPAAVLKDFLDSLNSGGVSVNLDPANLVMVPADDPVQAVYTLKDYIVHTHAKDGRKLADEDAEIIYGLKPGNPIVESASCIELPLGEGDVPFPAYLKALSDIGYKGYLTVEREVGDNPEDDIELAVKYLRQLML